MRLFDCQQRLRQKFTGTARATADKAGKRKRATPGERVRQRGETRLPWEHLLLFFFTLFFSFLPPVSPTHTLNLTLSHCRQTRSDNPPFPTPRRPPSYSPPFLPPSSLHLLPSPRFDCLFLQISPAELLIPSSPLVRSCVASSLLPVLSALLLFTSLILL